MKTGNEIIAEMDLYVEGQKEVKEMLIAALIKHTLKNHKYYTDHKKTYCKTIPLILGPTGCGKSYMLKMLGRMTDLPIVDVNAADLSTAGWSGASLGDILKIESYNVCKPNLEQAIVFIDEIDKIFMPRIGSGGTDHNKALQHSLLKIVEGTQVTDDKNLFHIDTSNMLFIFGGNFEDLRIKQKPGIGFKHDLEALPEIHNELIQMGVIPELAGRISMVSEVKPLTREQMRNILTNPLAGPLAEYNQMFRHFNLEEKTLTEEEINDILDTVIEKKVGVRGITAAIDEMMKDRLNSLPLQEALGYGSEDIQVPDGHEDPFAEG